MESLDFLLCFVVLLQTRETFLEYFLLLSLAIESFEFWFHRKNSQSINRLFENLIDEEISAHCLQLLFVSLSDSVIEKG